MKQLFFLALILNFAFSYSWTWNQEDIDYYTDKVKRDLPAYLIPISGSGYEEFIEKVVEKYLEKGYVGDKLILNVKKELMKELKNKCQSLLKINTTETLKEVLREHPMLQEKFTQYDKLVKKQDDEINAKINILKNKYIKLINSKQKKCNHFNTINEIPYISELLKEEIENRYKEDKKKCKREIYNKYQKLFYKERQKIIEEVEHKYEDQKKALKKYIDIAVKYAREKIRKRLLEKYKEFAYYMKYATYRDFQDGNYNQAVIDKINNFCRRIDK